MRVRWQAVLIRILTITNVFMFCVRSRKTATKRIKRRMGKFVNRISCIFLRFLLSIIRRKIGSGDALGLKVTIYSCSIFLQEVDLTFKALPFKNMRRIEQRRAAQETRGG